jgi:hypothetical protein
MPAGATFTGAWNIGQTSPDVLFATDSISFPLQYPDGVPGLYYVKGEGESEAEEKARDEKCGEGNAAKPDAEPGFVCIFQGPALGPATFSEFFSLFNLTENGLSLTFNTVPATEKEKEEGLGPQQQALLMGTWAVTAPEAP